MNLLREYIRELLVEWESANDQNLMLDQEGMEKSDRENVSSYLKSLGLLESFHIVPPAMPNRPRTASVFPGDRYNFPDIPYPPIDSLEGEQDLARTIIQYNNRVVPAELQEAADEDMDSLFRDFLDQKGITMNESYYKKLRVDLLPIIRSLKEYYDRPRPYQVAKVYGVDFQADPLSTVQSPSYPSGHAIQAYVIGLKLAEQFPAHRDGLLDVAELVSQSRVDRGVHFQSDIDFGRVIAYLIAEEMADGSA
jgi:hypothetical protein